MFADPLARVLIEYRPTALDTERKSSWMANVESILSMLLSSASAEEFLDMATKKIKDAEHTTKGVTLSSLHSAKGLEWETVFIAGAEDDQLPHHRSKNLEEERRLYFVGMTRAKHHLIVTYARSRFDKDKIPSRFLRESLVKVRQRTGVFKWLDDEITKPKVKAGMSGGAMPSSEASGNPKKSRREGRSYRYKGGKSLIPPEERGK